MNIRFSYILEKVLFHGEGRKRLVAVVSVKQEPGQVARSKEFYEELVEGRSPVFYLPDDESFPESLKGADRQT